VANDAPGSEGAVAGRIGLGWESARRSRYAASAPRYLVTLVLLVFLALGLRAAFFPPGQAPPPPQPRASADAPSHDFALQFARAYLTYDAASPGARTRALAPFVPDGLDSSAGFFPARGSQRVTWTQVASDQRALAGGRVITVAAGVSTQQRPIYLAVTVIHEPGEPLALGAYPSFVGAPVVDTAITPPEREAVTDKAVLQVVDRVVHNYLAGAAPNLKADLTSDAVVTLPTVALAVQSVDEVAWTAGPASGAVLATVTAEDRDGAVYTLAYELGIAYRERPYVEFIEVIPTDT
jgi:hypothetical protein